MTKKLSDLDRNEKIYFENLMQFMNETLNDDIAQRVKLARKFNLDLNDDDVIELLTPKHIHQQENYAVVTPPSKQESKIYGEEWVVIQNRLLHAISHLEFNERRLIMFLSPLVRKAVDIDPTQRTFIAKVKDFQKYYEIKGNYLYEELAEVADTILKKAFFFWIEQKKGKGIKSKKGVSWFSECDYLKNEGALQIKLDNTVIEMLTVFDKKNPFTKYERKMIIHLGVYGIVLLELIASCMHQKHKQKAYSIDYLREKFNCVDNYPLLADFKRYVLNVAIKDIEKNTTYRITYTQKKTGRIVTEIVFSFEDTGEKHKVIEYKSDNETSAVVVDNMTDSEIAECKRLADEHITKKGITDPKHITNIQNQARRERWDLGENEPQSTSIQVASNNSTQETKEPFTPPFRLKGNIQYD